jgi:hypothetical protein
MFCIQQARRIPHKEGLVLELIVVLGALLFPLLEFLILVLMKPNECDVSTPHAHRRTRTTALDVKQGVLGMILYLDDEEL